MISLDYDQLIAAYQEGLVTKLRAFRPDAESDFLETWVPDRDPVRSLLNLIEAAGDSGLVNFSIRLGPDISRHTDFEKLRQLTHDLGTLTICRERERVELQVSLVHH